MEYTETFRTKSYMEMCSKIQGHVRSNEESSPSPFTSSLHICDRLLEPRQDILLNMLSNTSGLHPLLLHNFEASLEACRLCSFLLNSINQTRASYHFIPRVLRLTERAAGDYTEEQCQFICAMFTSFVSLESTLLDSNTVQFRTIHHLYSSMFNRLTSTRKKVMRKVKFIRFCKKAMGISLVTVCGALTILALVLTTHSVIGLLATPLVMCFTFAFVKCKFKSVQRLKSKSGARLGSQLDAAARGAYILNRDFDTMSRLVNRLHDEIEHNRAVISIFLRSDNMNVLEEVVKELQNNEAGFLEQLEELEEHVFLCLLTINRARRLVVREIVVQQQH